MLIVDAHLDHAWNALQWNRDLSRPVKEIRAQEVRNHGAGGGRGMVAFPEMREGRIALCFATLLARSTGAPSPHLDYESPNQAYAVARGQREYYRALEREGTIRLITDSSQLDRHMDDWKTFDSADEADEQPVPPLGFVISMEGADPILDPLQLEEWWEGGLRLLGLTHYGEGRYAGGTGAESGLTELAIPLLKEMERLGIPLDLTHCTDQSFWEALDIFDGPVLASHNNCRALVPHQRQFSDDQILAIIERGGVIGVALDAWMLSPGWVIGESSNEGLILEAVVDHIDHIRELAGDCSHVGIGSDLDGGFGYDQAPSDVDTIGDLQILVGLLRKRGYKQTDIQAILNENWIRFLRKHLSPNGSDHRGSLRGISAGLP